MRDLISRVRRRLTEPDREIGVLLAHEPGVLLERKHHTIRQRQLVTAVSYFLVWTYAKAKP